ncbi:hypothetical protein SCLCIDRAFT_19457 [Scleroderma citrinum Foug A]|uniref:Uncharacterized protein n=1 Tax=Scleroderma citrinum Foug A TaxID=1036808 RepID=A0A0C3EA96_9AGAM|nr:hypothetical protein SCLCIDRAFT_19457 [Scleroderma citrinum Foug A]
MEEHKYKFSAIYYSQPFQWRKTPETTPSPGNLKFGTGTTAASYLDRIIINT